MGGKSQAPARRDDLVVQKLGEETIVYDPSTHKAHSLNRSASLVFEKLDGKRDLGAISRELGKELGKTARPELVATAVNELAAADLLRPGSRLPRRSVLRGLAAGLLPVVVSIAVPPAAAAGSCGSYGDPCAYYGDGSCCPGYECQFYGSSYACLPPYVYVPPS